MTRFAVPVESIKACLIVAAKDDIRHYLQGVCFDVNASRVMTVATDGHRLIAVRSTHSENDPPEIVESKVYGRAMRQEYLISRAALEDVVRGVKAGSLVQISIDAGMVTLASLKREIRAATIDAQFPDWRRIVPVKTSGEAGQYSAAYLFDFAKIAALFGVKSKGDVHVHHNGPRDAALITFGTSSDAIGVLMPYKSNQHEAAIEMIREEIGA